MRNGTIHPQYNVSASSENNPRHRRTSALDRQRHRLVGLIMVGVVVAGVLTIALATTLGHKKNLAYDLELTTRYRIHTSPSPDLDTRTQSMNNTITPRISDNATRSAVNNHTQSVPEQERPNHHNQTHLIPDNKTTSFLQTTTNGSVVTTTATILYRPTPPNVNKTQDSVKDG